MEGGQVLDKQALAAIRPARKILKKTFPDRPNAPEPAPNRVEKQRGPNQGDSLCCSGNRGQLPFFDSMAQLQFGRAVSVFLVEFVGEDGDDFVLLSVSFLFFVYVF